MLILALAYYISTTRRHLFYIRKAQEMMQSCEMSSVFQWKQQLRLPDSLDFL